MSKVKDVKGVRGLVKLAKEIAVTATTGCHDNEFIGRCRIPLKVHKIIKHPCHYLTPTLSLLKFILVYLFKSKNLNLKI